MTRTTTSRANFLAAVEATVAGPSAAPPIAPPTRTLGHSRRLEASPAFVKVMVAAAVAKTWPMWSPGWPKG